MKTPQFLFGALLTLGLSSTAFAQTTPGTTTPSSTITTPSGTTTPRGAMANPNGTMNNPNGTMVNPNGTMANPNRDITTPGTTTTPGNMNGRTRTKGTMKTGSGRMKTKTNM